MKIRPEWKLMAAAYVCLGSMALMGCVATPDRTGRMDFATSSARNAQLALTGLMALDTAQTASFSKSNGCIREGNPVASAVFGTDQPSAQRVLVTNAVYISGHWLLGSYLDRKASAPIDLSLTAQEDMAKRKRWQTLRTVYQLVTGLGHGVAVARNTALGIKPFSSVECGGAK